MELNARQITALISRDCVVDVLGALWSAGFRDVSVLDSSDHPLVAEAKRQHRHSDATDTTPLVRVVLICDRETEVAEAVALIRANSHREGPLPGRVYISSLLTTVELAS